MCDDDEILDRAAGMVADLFWIFVFSFILGGIAIILLLVALFR